MNTKSFVVVLVACLTALVLTLPSLAQAVDVAVVLNPHSSTSNISLADLRKVFAGEKRTWPGGIRIKLILREPGSHEWLVLLKLLGMSGGEYKQYWTAEMFRGDSDGEPFTAPSVGMAKEAAKVFPGAITLVDTQDIKPGMKVIRVDGRLPGEPGYPLR